MLEVDVNASLIYADASAELRDLSREKGLCRCLLGNFCLLTSHIAYALSQRDDRPPGLYTVGYFLQGERLARHKGQQNLWSTCITCVTLVALLS